MVWQGQVLDYESEFIYMLTEDLLHQLCGVNTTFSHISCGYGLFPPKSIQAMSPEVTYWGDSSLLEECNPVVLALILMLVFVGRLPLELMAVKIDFTGFLIIYLSFTKLLYS